MSDDLAIPSGPLGSPPQRLPALGRSIHKGDRGRLLVVAGSRRYAGAAWLAAAGAARGGAGLVEVALPAELAAELRAGAPGRILRGLPADHEGRLSFAALSELRRAALGADFVLVGPGLDSQGSLDQALRRLALELPRPLLLDACALGAIARTEALDALKRTPAPRLLTPHPGEAARLLGSSTAQVQADREGAARSLAERSGAIVVLKGAGTLVVEGRRITTCALGNPGMARGGMGDVLAGLIAALAMQGLDPGDAARLGVWVHACAGDRAAARRGEHAMLPEDLLEELPGVLTGCVG